MKLVVAGEHDDGDRGVAEHGELMGLLEDAVPPLRVGHLPVVNVFDLLYLHLPSSHISPLLCSASTVQSFFDKREKRERLEDDHVKLLLSMKWKGNGGMRWKQIGELRVSSVLVLLTFLVIIPTS